MSQKIKSNIWKYYLATALVHFGFFMPIIQLFYLDGGLTILKIATLGVIWTVVKMTLEIPSGIVADKWGRKKILVISMTFSVLQLVILTLATNFTYFVLASVLSAIAYSFLSGTDTAFFYDTLRELKREKEYEKLWARTHIYQQIPLLIAFTSAGFLYKISPVLPFKLSLIFLIFALFVTFTYKEPKYHKPLKKKSVFAHFSESAKDIFKNKFLRAMLFFTIIFSIGSDFSYGFGQIYLKGLLLPVALFGIVYTFKSIFVTTFANFAPSLRKKFSYKKLFGFQIIAITLIFYIMVLTNSYIVGAICFIVIAIPHGLFVISKSSYVNRHTKSHNRATIESMFSFFIGASILILEPGLGYLADLYSIKTSFLIIAIIMSVYAIYYFISGKNKI